MKVNILLTASCVAVLTSCSPKQTRINQLNLTNESSVDQDGYNFFQIVGGKAFYERDYAGYAESRAYSPQVKKVAAQVKELYSDMIPALDTLSSKYYVVFPVLRAERFHSPENQTALRDTSETDMDRTVEESTQDQATAYTDDSYLQHVQHESAIVKDQLYRLSRNTEPGLRNFAAAYLPKVNELFKLAGGKEDETSHH